MRGSGKRWVGAGVLALLGACGGGGGGGPGTDDLTGAWFLVPAVSGIDDDPLHLTIVQTGTALRATATCRDEWPPGTGSWSAGVLSLVFDFGGGNVLTLDGGAVGSGLAGTFAIPGTAGTWTMARTTLVLDCAHACDPVVVLPFVGTDFTDLAKVAEISLFRSSAGHDYSDDCEGCRSMKHYFAPFDAWRANATIPMRSPVDGTVVSVTAEGHGASPPGVNKQVRIRSSLHPEYTFVLFHVDLLANPVVPGQAVVAGEQVGWARMYYDDLMEFAHDFDLGVRVATPYGSRYVSWFETVTDALFAAYVARGATTRSDLVLSRAARDADPLTCVGETFTSFGTLPAWFVLGPP